MSVNVNAELQGQYAQSLQFVEMLKNIALSAFSKQQNDIINEKYIEETFEHCSKYFENLSATLNTIANNQSNYNTQTHAFRLRNKIAVDVVQKLDDVANNLNGLPYIPPLLQGVMYNIINDKKKSMINSIQERMPEHVMATASAVVVEAVVEAVVSIIKSSPTNNQISESNDEDEKHAYITNKLNNELKYSKLARNMRETYKEIKENISMLCGITSENDNNSRKGKIYVLVNNNNYNDIILINEALVKAIKTLNNTIAETKDMIDIMNNEFSTVCNEIIQLISKKDIIEQINKYQIKSTTKLNEI